MKVRMINTLIYHIYFICNYLPTVISDHVTFPLTVRIIHTWMFKIFDFHVHKKWLKCSCIICFSQAILYLWWLTIAARNIICVSFKKQIIKKQQEFIQLQITNNKDTINKLRNSHPIVCDNTQDDAAQSTADEDDVVNNEMYLQGMAVDRNWEIPRDRLTITEEKLGGGEFGIVNKGLYLRTDGNELPVAVKRLKGWYWSYSWLGGECS